MIKEKFLDSEYVDVSANNISIWGRSGRGIIFTWGVDIEQNKVSDILSMISIMTIIK
jgi:hypothetical protein